MSNEGHLSYEKVAKEKWNLIKAEGISKGQTEREKKKQSREINEPRCCKIITFIINLYQNWSRIKNSVETPPVSE